jgi:shikimate dehydrogenase
MSADFRKACVIGWPVSHSRSPLIHGHWLAKYQITGRYEAIPVSPDNLGTFLQELEANGYVGCNITIPHKEAAFQHVDDIDARGLSCGAINTVYLRQSKRHATSTDGIGFCDNVEACCPAFSFHNKTVMLFGTGGAARPIIDELLRRGVSSIFVTNRTLARAQDLVTIFGERLRAVDENRFTDVLPTCDLLINCTSLGMKGAGQINLDLAVLPQHAIVADIVYVPLVTDFLHQAQSRGLHIVPGLGMLLQQAVLGFEYWFGVKPLVTRKLYDLVAKDINPAYKPLMIIGLTGSIAMGKTEVARILSENGLPVFDADQDVHALYDSDRGAALLRPFAPTAVLGNKVDRPHLTALVMADKSLLEKLETVVHAEIAKRREAFIATAAEQGHAIVVVDVPLLFEKNGHADVTSTIVVSSTASRQHARAMARPGMTQAKFDMILSRQMPDHEKRQRADHIIENDGTLKDLQDRTLAVLHVLRHKASHA